MVNQFHDIPRTTASGSAQAGIPMGMPLDAGTAMPTPNHMPRNTGSQALTRIELFEPVDWHGVEIVHLDLRRPTGRDMRALPETSDAGLAEMYGFFSLIANCDEELIDELDGDDIMEIGDFIKQCSEPGKPLKLPKQMPSVFTFPLDHPIVGGAKPLAQLSMRRPKGKDMRALPKGDDGLVAMYPFIAKLADIEISDIDNMDVSDLAKAGEVAQRFLQKQKSTEKSSRRRRRG